MSGSRWSVVGLLVAFGAAGCGTAGSNEADAGSDAGSAVDAGPPVIVQPTLSSIQTNIFTLTCATSGCHSGTSVVAANGLDLTAGNAYANLVGVASMQQPSLLRVDPGNPGASFLVDKLTAPSCCYTSSGTCSSCTSWEMMGEDGGADGYGLPMPEIGSQLSSQQLQAIEDWINAGAPND